MSTVWKILFTCSIAYAFITGNGSSASAALLESGDRAVALMLTLTGAMTLWSGLVEILQDTGDVARLGRWFRRVARPLFPEVRDRESWDAMSMNLAANLLGLGNAATPSGIEAARRLAGQGDGGRRGLGMLLVLNNTGLQLIPTTVMTLRKSAGSAAPAKIWLPTLLVSAISTAVGVTMMVMLQKWGRRHARNG